MDWKIVRRKRGRVRCREDRDGARRRGEPTGTGPSASARAQIDWNLDLSRVCVVSRVASLRLTLLPHLSSGMCIHCRHPKGSCLLWAGFPLPRPTKYPTRANFYSCCVPEFAWQLLNNNDFRGISCGLWPWPTWGTRSLSIGQRLEKVVCWQTRQNPTNN